MECESLYGHRPYSAILGTAYASPLTPMHVFLVTFYSIVSAFDVLLHRLLEYSLSAFLEHFLAYSSQSVFAFLHVSFDNAYGFDDGGYRIRTCTGCPTWTV
jgi:hypothetical protein